MTLLVLIDLLGAILLAALAITGGILRWHLPPGSGHAEHGQGPKLLLGMNRHGWGDVHFWLSIGFLIVMFVHLYQHRAWITARLAPASGAQT